MPRSGVEHRREHNLLLINKLITLGAGLSPLTLILDTIEQTAWPLLQCFVDHASKDTSTAIIYVSLTRNIAAVTLPSRPNVEFFNGRGKSSHDIQSAILKLLTSPNSSVPTKAATVNKLVIINDVNRLIAPPFHTCFPSIAQFLIPIGSASPNTSVVAIYHTDIPDTITRLHGHHIADRAYVPSPLTILQHLATSILTVHSYAHLVARHKARERSAPEPQFGMQEEKDGIIIGLTDVRHSVSEACYVVELQHRRKSGREIQETYVFSSAMVRGTEKLGDRKERIVLLDDHPAFVIEQSEDRTETEMLQSSTFDLGLTEKQRKERDGTVLPYYDAQRSGTEGSSAGQGILPSWPGEGGRILYDMGVEDDFDEEEDEI